MRRYVTVPVLGDTTRVVVVDQWLVQPGSTVQEGQPLVSVETDKVNAEIPAPFAGQVVELLSAHGDEVEIGSPICVIEQG